jgi:hypothetical protein
MFHDLAANYIIVGFGKISFIGLKKRIVEG